MKKVPNIEELRETFKYDFCELQTEYGVENALVQLDEEGKPRKGFGLMNVPLKYSEVI